MRLGYFVPEFPSQTHVFFWREISALRGMGVVVTLLSSRRPARGACRHTFAEQASNETHYVFPPQWLAACVFLVVRPIRTARAVGYVLGLNETPWKRRLLLLGLLFSAADLARMSKTAQLQHIHVHSCADAAHVAALCRILGGPSYSLTLHGDLPVYGTDHASKMAQASFVACVTGPLQRQVMEAVGLSANRTPILWMGVDSERFQENELRKYESGRLHFVTVARLNVNKGHKHALAAMRGALDRGKDIRYTIAGEGPDRPMIEEEIRRVGVGDRVEITGTLSEDAVLDLLQRADAFMLPSVRLGEAAPVSVMEAMACGLPVICSIIGGTPDMINSGTDGLLIPQADEIALAEALVLLADRVDERKRLGRAARERAVNAFDSRRVARRFLDLIESSVGAAPTPAPVSNSNAPMGNTP